MSNRADSDFVLTADDPATPMALYAWSKERVRLGLSRAGDADLVEAVELGMRLEREGRGDHLKSVVADHKAMRTVEAMKLVVGASLSPAEMVALADWAEHPTAPGWMWNRRTNEVISEADFDLRLGTGVGNL